MKQKKLLHIQALLSHTSSLSFHMIESTDSALFCLDHGLRTQFQNSNQLYENLRQILRNEFPSGNILHLQDTFHLHYVLFQPDPAEACICALGPFAENTKENIYFFHYLQQLIPLAICSADSVISAANNILALLNDSLPHSVQQLQLQDNPALPLRPIPDLQRHAESHMHQLIYYIQSNLHQKITLKSLSEHFGFSPTYISHHFKNEIGLPPMQYINNQRLIHSQYLLRSTTTPIKEIAHSVGISDCSYFTKLFREYTGMTPSEYRNVHQ